MIGMLGLWFLVVLPVAFANVVELDAGGFEDKVGEKEFTLVMFYAPWCGHCKHLKPHFEEAAGLLSKSAHNVQLARLDCTVHGEKCTTFGVTGYPTVKLFKNGLFFKEYDGSRDTNGIREFMLKNSRPPSTKIDTVAELNALIISDETASLPLVVAYIKEKDDSTLKVFEEVASSLLGDAVFAHTHDQSVLDSAGDSNVRLHRPRQFTSKLEDKTVDYSQKFTSEALNEWIRQSQFGLIGYRSPQNEKFFPKNELVVFYHNASHKSYLKGVNYHRNRLIKLLKDSQKPDWKFTFAYSYSGDYYHEMSDLGESDESLPVVAIYSSGKKYKLTNYSPDAFLKFLSDFQAGSLVPHIKSEPVPEHSDEAAVKVVGSTFDDMINDPTKDVFIMFHAPWCGHCKKLMPTFKEAAEKLRHEDSVRFALYDATANDIPEPYSVRGYPTLYFAPKNGKKSPKLFQGSRELDDLIKFVAKESTDELRGFDRDGVQKKTEL